MIQVDFCGNFPHEQYKTDEDAADFNNLIIDGTDVIVRRWLDNDFYVFNFNTNYRLTN